MAEGYIGTVWGMTIAENETLVHLDLSYNRISEKDSEGIAAAL